MRILFANTITDALVAITDAIWAVLETIGDFINDLLFVIELLGKAVLNLPTYISWLPSPVIALIIGCFSIVVIYKVLGREG